MFESWAAPRRGRLPPGTSAAPASRRGRPTSASDRLWTPCKKPKWLHEVVGNTHSLPPLQRLKPCRRFIRRPELAVCIATHFLLQHPGRLSAAGAESRLPQRRIIEPASDALDRHHPRDLVVAPTPRTPDRAYLVCHLTPPLGLSRGYARPSSACGWPAMWSTQFARFGAGHLEDAKSRSRPGRSRLGAWIRSIHSTRDGHRLQIVAALAERLRIDGVQPTDFKARMPRTQAG